MTNMLDNKAHGARREAAAARAARPEQGDVAYGDLIMLVRRFGVRASPAGGRRRYDMHMCV